jgi:hypothetical protein
MGSWTSFEESFIHTDDHRVLGYRLRPFSLYHQFLLESIGSPIITGKAQITVIDLEIACRICASGYNEYRRASARPGFWQKVAFAKKVLMTDLPKEIAKFDRYFADYVALPERHGSAAPSKNGKVYQEFPSPLSIAGLLMVKGFEGGCREKIWMTPLGEAHWYCATFLRLEGVDLKLITDHDREFIEGLKRQREEKAKKEAAEASGSGDGVKLTPDPAT